MALVLLIFNIISGMVGLANLIEKIVKLIDGRSGSARGDAEHDLRNILRKHRDCKDEAGCRSELEELHDRLVKESGLP